MTVTKTKRPLKSSSGPLRRRNSRARPPRSPQRSRSVSLRVRSGRVAQAVRKGRCRRRSPCRPRPGRGNPALGLAFFLPKERGWRRQTLGPLPALTSSASIKGSFEFVHGNSFKRPGAAFLGNDHLQWRFHWKNVDSAQVPSEFFSTGFRTVPT